jgi:hypothetical protein
MQSLWYRSFIPCLLNFCEKGQGHGQVQITIQRYHRIPCPSKPYHGHQNQVSTINSKKVMFKDVKSRNGGSCQGQGERRLLVCNVKDGKR